jgi:serine/threonine-protein kinase HipA
MTSRNRSAECFVYITLPQKTGSVTAGKFQLVQGQVGLNVGRFIYGRSYIDLKDAVEIDPVELKLMAGQFETSRMNGIFGALRDAGPDFWGRYVIEKHANNPVLNELDYLLLSPEDRAGALGFGLSVKPPAPFRKFNKTITLEKLQRIADLLLREQIQEHDFETIQTQELMFLKTSMGGARPKAVVEDGDGLWVAKFSRPDDRWNSARVEHAMLELARTCGINSAISRIENIAGKDVLLVKRFDRNKVDAGYFKARMVSGLTLLRADETERDKWSYVSMAEELRRVVAEPKRDSLELFKRVCFNALVSNIDDHPRNHAVIAFDREWRLSPAYDLTPTPSISIERRDLAMQCGDLGRYANQRNLLSQRSRFLLAEEEANKIIAEMAEQIKSSWYSLVRSHGVSEKDANAIKNAFAYEGFFY